MTKKIQCLIHIRLRDFWCKYEQKRHYFLIDPFVTLALMSIFHFVMHGSSMLKYVIFMLCMHASVGNIFEWRSSYAITFILSILTITLSTIAIEISSTSHAVTIFHIKKHWQVH